MHCPWSRKTRAWGYEVIRGIDEDDPVRVIRAFRHPVGLAFVDLNTQVRLSLTAIGHRMFLRCQVQCCVDGAGMKKTVEDR